MGFLSRPSQVSVAICFSVTLLLGCTREPEAQVRHELEPQVFRFYTVDETERFHTHWPTMALTGMKPNSDQDIGGVHFHPGTTLTAKHAHALSKLENLTVIVAEYCFIRPEFFEGLAGTAVSHLGLSNSNVDDTAANAIASLPNVKVVIIYNTSVTKSGLETLRTSIDTDGIVVHPI